MVSQIDAKKGSRRGWLAGVAGLRLVLVGCRSNSGPDVVSNGLSYRDILLVVPVRSVGDLGIPSSRIRALCEVVLPPTTMARFPMAWLLHAIRLWGNTASFDDLEFNDRRLQGHWAETMFRILTENSAYSVWSAPRHHCRLFQPSPYGVQVRTTFDLGVGSEWSSTHPGTHLSVLAELRTPISQRIQVSDSDKNDFRLHDVANDDALRIHRTSELEWTSVALAKYARFSAWKNRFGQAVSCDWICEQMCKRPLGDGACFGCHVPFALASLLDVNRQNPILTPAVAEVVRDHIRELGRGLSACQQKDGSWPVNWPSVFGQRNGSARDVDSSVITVLTVTGHHLEWMMVAPQSLRPKADVIRRAARYLVDTILRLRPDVDADWHFFLPVSHAAKAVLNAAGYEFAAELFLENTQ